MSRLSSARALFISIVALGSLSVVANASAAAWQPPLQISEPTVNVGDTTARIALGASGDAAAAWWDEGASGRVLLARKRAGAAWSAPVSANNATGSTPVLVGVDGAGDVTAAYTTTGTITQIVSWPAGAAAPTQTALSSSMVSVHDLAVNAAGDAVVSGRESGSGGIVVAYRRGFTGAWSGWHSFTGPTFAGTASDVAINAAGTAVVVFRANTELWASTRTATTDWPAATGRVTPSAPLDNTPSVAIDGAGGVWTAYTVASGTTSVLRTSYLSPGAPLNEFQESGDLATVPGSTTTSVAPQIVINAGGTALLVWQQTSAGAIQARVGSTGNRIWGVTETVNDAGANAPVAAISGDGTAVVAWERFVGAGNLGQASVRQPSGGWSDIHSLTAVHANSNEPSISTDGLGDFATISAPYDGTTAKHAVVSVYDAAPPTLAAPALSGTLLAGDPVSMVATATDAFSTVAAPAWTFGDGGTGAGSTVAHAYAAAGTFPVHVTVTDGAGNSSSKDVAVTVGSPQATLTSAKFAGKWKVSRVTGSLTVVGTAPRAGTYTFDVFKGKTRKIHVSSKIDVAGVFTRKITLPAKFLPGTYTVNLVPGDAQVKGASRTASLAAPASGVVDVAFLSGARSGTAARTLTGATTIWASFHFAAKPKGTVTLTWYRVGKKLTRIGSTKKNSATKIVSYLRIGKTFVGTYQAVLSRNGVVIARASVKAKKA